MIKFGLCCIFKKAEIKFRQTTITYLKKLTNKERYDYINGICLHNSQALKAALKFCADNDIRAFRILSQILPAYSHPDINYTVKTLNSGEEILNNFMECRQFAAKNNIRLSFHPDQFVVLSSPKKQVVQNSINELEYQNTIADIVGADMINIHGGGAYGDKIEALERFCANFVYLSDSLKDKLTIENDDVTFSPADLLPICEALHVPMVYDIHHHRCNNDEYSEEEATSLAVHQWKRCKKLPHFHISSPREGWNSGKSPNPHADYIDIKDFPENWLNIDCSIDIEAKAKELAVLDIKQKLSL